VAKNEKGLVRAGDVPLLKQMSNAGAGSSFAVPVIAERYVKALTHIQERLLTAPDGTEEIVYQHSVLCQTCIPYRNPGDDVTIWRRRNGRVRMQMQAGHLLDPQTDEYVEFGLPYGPKPRLVLYHLNTEAIRTQSPNIELEDSLTAFVKRVLGPTASNGGRAIRTVKDQLNRLAASNLLLGATDGTRAVTIDGKIVKKIELWTPKDARQRVLWPSTVQFSLEYFLNLVEHAVPLNEGAVGALAHSSMGLDTYTWLAQRLHRVPPGKPAFVPWTAIKEQFGEGYDRIRAFKQAFRNVLGMVKTQYSDANFNVDDKGMLLHNSKPPVPRRDLLK
jgi:hypothetical protein